MSAAEFNLGRHCGITFARIKPASLFTVKEEDIQGKGFCVCLYEAYERQGIILCVSYRRA